MRFKVNQTMHFYLLTEIYSQPTKIENFNRQPTSGPPDSDPLKLLINSVLAQQLSGNLRSNNSNNLNHYYYYY